VPQATGSRHRVSAPYQAFQTGDGYIIIGAANQRTWERLCSDVLGRPEWITDPRFATNSDRMANIHVLEPLLEAEFAHADAATWIQRCEAASVPCGPINDFGQAVNDPHYAARGMIQELDHPRPGRMKTIGIPTHFSRTPGQVRMPAPLHGQHTDEVLERFGVDAQRRDRLRREGAIQ